jgi:hypothetical protein
MGTKVKELQDPRTAPVNACRRPCCHKDLKRVPHDRVWAWSRAHPGVQVLKPGVAA